MDFGYTRQGRDSDNKTHEHQKVKIDRSASVSRWFSDVAAQSSDDRTGLSELLGYCRSNPQPFAGSWGRVFVSSVDRLGGNGSSNLRRSSPGTAGCLGPLHSFLFQVDLCDEESFFVWRAQFLGVNDP